MKIKFIVSAGGVDVSYEAGNTYEVEIEEAKRFIDAGIAEEIKEKKGK